MLLALTTLQNAPKEAFIFSSQNAFLPITFILPVEAVMRMSPLIKNCFLFTLLALTYTKSSKSIKDFLILLDLKIGT